jgi:hypothetical protein
MSLTAQSVLAKTPKGVDEIATRAHKLPARLRTALVMVDGQKSVEDLLSAAGPLAEQLETQFADLLKSGFVADKNPAPAPAPVVVPTASTASVATTISPIATGQMPKPSFVASVPLAPVSLAETKPSAAAQPPVQSPATIAAAMKEEAPAKPAEVKPEPKPKAEPEKAAPKVDMRNSLFGRS